MDSLEEKNNMIDKLERDLLSSQMMVSSLEEEILQVKGDTDIKDETNRILIAEKNS